MYEDRRGKRERGEDDGRTGEAAVPAVRRGVGQGEVKKAQDAWNTRDPEKVALAYTEDSVWRNRDEFFEGREEIRAFLERKWGRELDYRLQKNLWCFTEDRIAVRFEYESRDADERWWRGHGNDRLATKLGVTASPSREPGVELALA